MSLFSIAHSSKTSLSRLSKFLLRFLFLILLTSCFYLYKRCCCLLFLFTDDQYGGFFVYQTELWETGFMISIEVNNEPSIKGQLDNVPFNVQLN